MSDVWLRALHSEVKQVLVRHTASQAVDPTTGGLRTGGAVTESLHIAQRHHHPAALHVHHTTVLRLHPRRQRGARRQVCANSASAVQPRCTTALAAALSCTQSLTRPTALPSPLQRGRYVPAASRATTRGAACRAMLPTVARQPHGAVHRRFGGGGAHLGRAVH